MKKPDLFYDADLLRKNGYLEGMKPENQEIYENLVMQITNKMVKGNELAAEKCIPIIRHIVNHITEPDERHSFSLIHHYLMDDFCKDFGVTKEKLLAEINIEEFMNALVIYCQEFLPLAGKYLPHLDGEAELTLLFSHNYMMRILNNVIWSEENKIENDE